MRLALFAPLCAALTALHPGTAPGGQGQEVEPTAPHATDELDPDGASGENSAGSPSRPGEDRTPLPFSARAELPTSGKPVGVLLHDFDGDGRDLLVAATLDPGTLHWWTTPLAAPTVIPVPDYPLGPVLLELATLDAIAIASRSSEEMLVFAPTAEHPSKPLHRIPLLARPRALGAGPLVGAETPSVVVATASDELVVIDHRGTARFPLLDGLPTLVLVEPGLVLVGSQEDRCVRAYRLQPDGTLRPDERPLRLGGIPRDALRVAHDGASECWVVGGDHALWRLGGLERGEPARLGGARLGTVPFALELLPASERLASLSVLDLAYTILDGERPVHRGRTGQDPWGLACGDLDGDGRADLAFANRGARRVSLVLGREDGRFHEATHLPVGRGPHALAAADLNGDGVDELLVVNAMDQELAVLARDPSADGARVGGGAPVQVTSRHSAAPAGDCLAIADVDGDGHLDVGLLVRAADGARLRLFFGNGRGDLAVRPGVPDLACGASVGDLWLGDLDGDGKAEALVADPSAGRVHLLVDIAGPAPTRTGLDVPNAPGAIAVDDRGRIFVALGDPGPRVGFAELACITGGERPELIERSFTDLGLPFADVSVVPGADPRRTSLALLAKPSAGDGTGWLVVATEGDEGEEDAGAWREVERLRTGLRPFAVTAGDFDGDGFAEVFVGAQNSHHVNFWRGSGQGLAPMPDIGTGRGILDVILARLDPDGRPSLVVANGFSGDLSLVRPR